MSTAKKTCFVIIGFGPKTDYATGRVLDMDKTFENIIKPAFEAEGFICYRACDLTHSGMIDIPMYDNILKADFVVADISTLNPNVLYELGIRHAVRKNATLVISETELVKPFDINHIVIDTYEHWGKGIEYDEVLRFRELLQKKIIELQQNPKTDSPLYSLFPELNVPTFSKVEVQAIEDNIKDDGSLSDILGHAEAAKAAKDYSKAISLLEQALGLNQDNILITQRLALMTYKSKLPDEKSALLKAAEILKPLNPHLTTDVETLGLSGAIHKRLHEIDGDSDNLNQSTFYYEKGFYIASDYYNGINLAFLFELNASLVQESETSIMYRQNAKRIRRQVKEICNHHQSDTNWSERDDKDWILLTLAEIAFAEEQFDEENVFIEQAKQLTDGEFAISSYLEQREKLAQILRRTN
ncbi:tetratricopeptide repeat-containing protein [Pedobacter aquatilis]|uniref:tetratricopeptide repeat-containing protein n=1 Tax=Pedobacter aquatilis TaxID=351343 RepID=UPI0029312FA6|nr:tetratricopeptide repeat-containing protein [Pedobacter aquatilis]